MRQECPLSSSLFKTVLELLATAIRQEKKIKGTQIEKEVVKLFLFANLVVLYFKEHQDSIKKLFYPVNTFGKLIGYKINF
jgi:hypothetical protein